MADYANLNVKRFDEFLRRLILDPSNASRYADFNRAIRLGFPDWFDDAHPETDVLFDPRTRAAVKHSRTDLTRIARALYLVTWEFSETKPKPAVVFRATGTTKTFPVGSRVQYKPTRILASWTTRLDAHNLELQTHRQERGRHFVTTFATKAPRESILWTPDSHKTLKSMLAWAKHLQDQAPKGSDVHTRLSDLFTSLEIAEASIPPNEREVVLYLPKPVPCKVVFSAKAD